MTKKDSNCNVDVILGKTIRQYASAVMSYHRSKRKPFLTYMYYKRMSSEYLTCCLVSSIILLMMFPCFRSVHFQKKGKHFPFPKLF